MKHALFICTGNYYRSRFAEILFNHLADQQEISWRAISKGYRADNPANVGYMSSYAEEGLKQRDIPIQEIRFPEKLTEEDLQQADIIIALKEKEHRPLTQQLFPAWEDKIIFWHIDDIDASTPQDALPLLEEKVKALMDSIPQDL
jgi:protein-tyrosine phosphatase